MEEGVSYNFPNRLDREELTEISKFTELPISWAKACCKPVWICLG